MLCYQKNVGMRAIQWSVGIAIAKQKTNIYCQCGLKRKDIDNTFKIDGQEIDSQYIKSSHETIKQDICRIVEQASLSGFFDYYIERYEYTCKCFDCGSDIIDQDVTNNAK